MTEEKIVREETKEEVKALKDTTPAKWGKVLVSSGSAIAATAITTAVIKQFDLSGIKGYKKLLIPVGIFGISTFVSRSASKAVEDELNDTFDAMDVFRKIIRFIYNNKITNVSVTPTDEGQVVVNMDGEPK